VAAADGLRAGNLHVQLLRHQAAAGAQASERREPAAAGQGSATKEPKDTHRMHTGGVRARRVRCASATGIFRPVDRRAHHALPYRLRFGHLLQFLKFPLKKARKGSFAETPLTPPPMRLKERATIMPRVASLLLRRAPQAARAGEHPTTNHRHPITPRASAHPGRGTLLASPSACDPLSRTGPSV
jgi:hypothetical protein